MPEEINRKVTDAISDILFTPSRDADENLMQEGVEKSKIHFVGNIMIDSLVSILKRIDQSYEDQVFHKFGLERNNFVLVTLHRPSNVDDVNNLRRIMTFLKSLSLNIPIIFPVHPRTRKSIDGVGTDFITNGNFQMVEPLRYKEFIALEKSPRFVLTDSGGIQEETTYFRVPCLTLRPNTERPITITQGTNELVSLENAEAKASSILLGNWKEGNTPERWDGNTAKRIVNILKMVRF
jgi:UDP-N-acetylglucosamine 2-epimerase (non-hydrolysing)